MSETNPDSSQTPASAPAASQPNLQPEVVLAALGSSTRWAIVKMLATGRPQCIADIAAAVGGSSDTVSKQLWVLQRAGVLDFAAGEDRRQTMFFVPAVYREYPGVLDFGFCQLQFPDVLPRGKD